MPTVTPRFPGEYFDSMFNRFKRLVDKAGVMDDIRRHEFYEKPTAVRKRKKAAAVKRAKREERERNPSFVARKKFNTKLRKRKDRRVNRNKDEAA